MSRSWLNLIKTAGICLWSFLAVGGLFSYKGSSLIYILFSLIFLLFFVDGLHRRFSLGYLFLVIFLWLGFWLKLAVHLTLDYQYLEPVGSFNARPEMWDAVLEVSMLGVMGVMCAKYLFLMYTNKHNGNKFSASTYVPSWYPFVRSRLWAAVLVVIVLLPILNFLYGIFQVGVEPSHILPWPLNGLISWFMSFGLAAIVTTLVFWDDSTHQGWLMGGLATLIEGFLSSVSILSRATYIFHTVPYLIVWYNRYFSKNKVNVKSRLVVFSWLGLLILSLMLVTLLRYSTISHIDNGNKFIEVSSASILNGELVVNVSKKVSTLIVDRWIGLEGVMAIVSYPEKNVALLKQGFLETRVKGSLDFYTKNIAKVELTAECIEKNQYASIPGGVAFFYYTGSFVWVITGMACLTFFMFFLEGIAFFMTRNPYFCAFWSMGLAQTVASFGLGVWQMAVYYIVCLIAMFFIWLVQNVFRDIGIRRAY